MATPGLCCTSVVVMPGLPSAREADEWLTATLPVVPTKHAHNIHDGSDNASHHSHLLHTQILLFTQSLLLIRLYLYNHTQTDLISSCVCVCKCHLHVGFTASRSMQDVLTDVEARLAGDGRRLVHEVGRRYTRVDNHLTYARPGHACKITMATSSTP